ncbi:MAG: DUF459 domain-containing protein [Actinomycetota bacterium]|nr:DUF459 domain-containing protein [Actinomycetota bacterium]
MSEQPHPREPLPRRSMPAGRALVVVFVCLVVWGFLYAPELQRSARASDVGTRRSISLALLSPLVWISDHVGLTNATDAAARLAGRDPNAAVGGVDTGTDPLPSVPPSSRPSRSEGPPIHDTEIREPTPDRQLRIAIVGDSLAQGIGYAADSVFKPFWVEVYKQGRISTGLARPDFYDWPAQMQTIVERADPDLVLIMLGENDNQGLLYPDGSLEQDIGTWEWASHYQERIEQFAVIATSGGAHVIWIGLPNEPDHGRWDFIEKQNAIFEAVADALPNVAYFDTWDEFADADGGYSAYYRDGNKLREVRSPDGVHFNTDGYTLVVERAAQFATREFDLDPKTYGE